jgi:hypothetical protein
MRVLPLGLMVVCSIAVATSLPAPEFVPIDDSQIHVIAQTLGQDEPQRQLIRARLSGWKQMLESPQNQALDDRAKLQRVNDFVNETPFQCDAAHLTIRSRISRPSRRCVPCPPC